MNKSLLVGTRVVVNTGGKDALALIVKGGTHGSYWKEQDSYRIEFNNGTIQYMPTKYLRATGGGMIPDNELDPLCDTEIAHEPGTPNYWY